MIGYAAHLMRHPIKGFTPERMVEARLRAGCHFPCDRIYAVERGRSGFDPTVPQHISKWQFTVLANHARLAQLVTAYDCATNYLRVDLEQRTVLCADLSDHSGRAAFAHWLSGFLGEAEDEVLNVVACAPAHRFTDDADGFVSLINLESVRDLERRMGVNLNPLRMRANIYVEGEAPWAELRALAGAKLRVGEVILEVIKPIPRCVAVHVDPATGVRDLDVVGALRQNYGHVDCGLYLRVATGGRLREGDVVEPA